METVNILPMMLMIAIFIFAIITRIVNIKNKETDNKKRVIYKWIFICCAIYLIVDLNMNFSEYKLHTMSGIAFLLLLSIVFKQGIWKEKA